MVVVSSTAGGKGIGGGSTVSVAVTGATGAIIAGVETETVA